MKQITKSKHQHMNEQENQEQRDVMMKQENGFHTAGIVPQWVCNGSNVF